MSSLVSEILTADRIACGLAVSSKKRALEKLSELIAGDREDLSAGEVFDCLLARERLGSTGLGHGVALPHGRFPGVDRAVGAFVRLSAGVDYDAIDREPVDLLFGLVLPDGSPEENLRTLASLAELFDDPALRERLRTSERCEDLYQVLAGGAAGGAGP
jgi:PTS system nitrogen regulatory IIA component